MQEVWHGLLFCCEGPCGGSGDIMCLAAGATFEEMIEALIAAGIKGHSSLEGYDPEYVPHPDLENAFEEDCDWDAEVAVWSVNSLRELKHRKEYCRDGNWFLLEIDYEEGKDYDLGNIQVIYRKDNIGELK
ncbi:MAG: hypothetical protein UT24_C0015G0019 [Candidatus Woesebacteria bacterium GW2011_GWB1_39_12]|uniref:Uncharacterized protein n=1 Tax=Candidatus Woesebacteria bacterium GW2011_GWB1_39_12 TaxID=1618574 RepID=A0A0G0MIM9_9BACT|nr:MAG: hypothetical protein UT24_C0015G0019 [Candidatus Woesebacteria bacterium GW2011_GWB1_39_12]